VLRHDLFITLELTFPKTVLPGSFLCATVRLWVGGRVGPDNGP